MNLANACNSGPDISLKSKHKWTDTFIDLFTVCKSPFHKQTLNSIRYLDEFIAITTA